MYTAHPFGNDLVERPRHQNAAAGPFLKVDLCKWHNLVRFQIANVDQISEKPDPPLLAHSSIARIFRIGGVTGSLQACNNFLDGRLVAIKTKSKPMQDIL